jgi:signal transduction histidine kinase
MSDKILYSEAKAEQSFLTLINAAISHELRNPLNSLVGQMNSMQSFLLSFAEIVHILKKKMVIWSSLESWSKS